MWYKNITGRFFGLVRKHACDRPTGGRTDRENYDSQDRASIAASRGKNHFFYSAYRCWIQISTVDVINIAADRQKFMTLTGALRWQRLRRSAVPGILVENRRFNLPPLYLVPPLGGDPLEFRRDLWHQKTRKIALSCGIKMSPVGSLD